MTKQLAYVGTSITANASLPTGLRYTTLTEQWMAAKPQAYAFLSSLNSAHGGGTSWVGLTDVATVIASNPDVILIEYAVNDGYTDFFARTEEALIRKLRVGCPGARLVFMAFTRIGNVAVDDATNLNDDLKQRWMALCTAYGVQFVDYSQALIDAVAGGGHCSDYMTDTVHINDGGSVLAFQTLRETLYGAVLGGSMPALPDRIYDCSDFENDAILRNGVINDGETGTWSTNGTDRVSSEANATITFSGTFASFGLYHGGAGVIQYKLDDGAFSESKDLSGYGSRFALLDTVIARAAHTVVIKVISGTVTIKQFMSI